METYLSFPTISYETAARVVATVMEIGARQGVHPVASVASPSLLLVAYGASDHSTPHSAETSRRKAMTSASTRRPSSRIPAELVTSLPLGTGGMLTPIDGGVPLFFEGVLVGGLGVAGGTPAQDAAVAVEVLRAIGADAIGDAR